MRARPNDIAAMSSRSILSRAIFRARSTAFYKENLNADLTLKPRDVLAREFTQLIDGHATVLHQCGSGVTACMNLFAMEYAGLTGSRLYAGSWSEWIADPSRPTVTKES